MVVAWRPSRRGAIPQLRNEFRSAWLTLKNFEEFPLSFSLRTFELDLSRLPVKSVNVFVSFSFFPVLLQF